MRLHALKMKVELLVIDEAAQLKECESVMPLQLSGLRDVVLIGDEKQLPAMVQSRICMKAEFGRSLFERLVLLKYTTHLLNVQYRMHPMISLFPNKEFYNKKILDGPNMKERSFKKQFLKGKMFGTYNLVNY
uniref:Probable helicase MAGATAMA 3 n=1 Tax=Tanacetum cinerariifolium TaxID=118510 RepID=A0A699REK5_TANCI|nr:probable helicase MAGATAMA 3 [Tanacetum cinerariifolium]